LARRSLKPQLNQIRTWVRQGRTDAWIAHQLDVAARDITSFKREHDLAPDETATNGESDMFGPRVEADEPDLRAEDDALVAAALDAEQDDEPEDEDDSSDDTDDSIAASDEGASNADSDSDRPKSRRRGRRGGRGRRRGGRKPLDGTFDHGEEGYGLWLDPAVQDDAVYAEHWAGQRAVTVAIEPDRIVITRSGDSGGDSQSGPDD
jgi:hypothetical protein